MIPKDSNFHFTLAGLIFDKLLWMKNFNTIKKKKKWPTLCRVPLIDDLSFLFRPRDAFRNEKCGRKHGMEGGKGWGGGGTKKMVLHKLSLCHFHRSVCLLGHVLQQMHKQ